MSSIISQGIHDPQLLKHPLLGPYLPSERRAILHLRILLSEREQREVRLEQAIAIWEDGPAKQWRQVKASRDCSKQADEIERHKYFLSQKKGYDVGREVAAVDWVTKYAATWRLWWEEQPDSGSEPV